MTRIGVCAAASLALSTASTRAADTVGGSMRLLGDNLFQTLIRDGMDRYVRTLSGVALQVEDVGANNDEMALGAAKALKSAGKGGRGAVGGIGATADGLKALDDGDIAVTVFQDAPGQGRGAIDAVLKLARGESVPTKV